jgi:hypothetical protein
MKSKILWVAAVLLLVLSTACSSSAVAAPKQAPAQSSNAVTPASTLTLPLNSITTTATLTVSHTPSGPIPTGSFKPDHPLSVLTLILKPDGTYEGLGPPGKTPIGTYIVSGDHVTFTEAAVEGLECQGKPGEYTWSYDGSTLVFKVVNDDCGQRRVEWPFSKWVKQP